MTTVLEGRQPRRGTASAWTSADPVLAQGELGLETDTGRTKRGDGSTAWSSLDYEQDAANLINTPSGNLAATTVQGALNELQTDVDSRLLSADVLDEDDLSTDSASKPPSQQSVKAYATPKAVVPVSGRWYAPIGAVTTTTFNDSVLYFAPVRIDDPATIDRIRIEVVSAGTAGAVVRVGLYEDDAGIPGALLVDAGTVDATSTGFKDAVVSQLVGPPLVWVGVVHQGGASTKATLRSQGGDLLYLPILDPSKISFDLASMYQVGITGALPDPAVPATNTNRMPRTALRIA